MNDLINIAQEVLKKTDKLILDYFQKPLNVNWKADQSPVTIADQKSEEIARNFLFKETPGFGFVGEEGGYDAGDGEYHWVMDPIDGTKSFIHGVPLFGTLLALLKNGNPILGFIHMPALRSTVWAALGQGCFLDQEKILVSKVTNLKESLLLSGTVNTFENKGQGDAFKNLRHACKLYRGWGDCYGYYLVLSGRAEIMVDPIVSLWDIAPMPVLFAEAGGSFSFMDGTPFNLPKNYWQQKNIVADEFTAIASNGLLHQKVVEFF